MLPQGCQAVKINQGIGGCRDLLQMDQQGIVEVFAIHGRFSGLDRAYFSSLDHKSGIRCFV